MTSKIGKCIEGLSTLQIQGILFITNRRHALESKYARENSGWAEEESKIYSVGFQG